MREAWSCAIALGAAWLLAAASASAASDDEMAQMQKQLNAQVMSRPFTVEDQAKIDAYVEDAMKKDIKPPTEPPPHWLPGYTCMDLWRYAYDEYRDCFYYHRYYGHYWR